MSSIAPRGFPGVRLTLERQAEWESWTSYLIEPVAACSQVIYVSMLDEHAMAFEQWSVLALDPGTSSEELFQVDVIAPEHSGRAVMRLVDRLERSHAKGATVKRVGMPVTLR